MNSSIGKLANLISGEGGYFREGEGSTFPWHANDRSIWYALLVVEKGHIVRYGFSSSRADKHDLCSALEFLTDKDEALFLGVWNGQWRTDLFVLQPAEALAHLRGEKKWARFDHLRSATNVVKCYGPKGGFRGLSYEYINKDGVTTHVSQSIREEAEELEDFFKAQRIKISEKRK